MQIGAIKFFNELKGSGFISLQDNQPDIFVHASGLIDQIRENDQVKFNVVDGRKGVNAVDVEVV